MASALVPLMAPNNAGQNPQAVAGQLATAIAQGQEAQMQVQQMHQDMQDQSILTQAFRQANGDPDQTQKIALDNGVSSKGILGYQAQRAQLLQHLGTYNESQLKMRQAYSQSMAQAFNALRMVKDPSGDPAKTRLLRATVLPDQIASLVKGGMMTQNDGNGIIQAAQADPTYLDDDPLQIHEAFYTAHDKMTEIARNEQQAKTSAATQAKDEAETREKNLQLAGQTSYGVKDQPTYTDWLNGLDPAVRKRFSPTYSPGEVQRAQRMGIASPIDQQKLDLQNLTNAAASLGAAAASGKKDVYSQVFFPLQATNPDLAAKFPHPDTYDPAKTPALVREVGMTPEQQTTATQAANNSAETQRHNAVVESQGNRRVGIEQQNANIRAKEADPFGVLGINGGGGASGGGSGTPGVGNPAGPIKADDTGDALLQKLPPPIAGQVKALAEGRQAFPSGAALSKPYWQNMLGMVAKYDPSFDAVNYNARAATRKSFTSGNNANAINGLNTAIAHLDELSNSADGLNNTDIQLWNKVKNAASEEFGNKNITNFKATVNRLAPEIVRAYRGSGGSEKDIQDALHDFSTAASPEQLHGAIAQTVKLMQGKLEALQDQYQKGMGTTAAGLQILTPKSQQTVQKLLAKAGQKAEVPTPSYKNIAIGPNGHKIGLIDGKGWVDIQTGQPVQ